MSTQWNSHPIWTNEYNSIQNYEAYQDLLHPSHDKPKAFPQDPDYHLMPRRLFTASLPTPDKTPDSEDDKATVSISSVFYPGADDHVTDTILRASDGVLFYVSSSVLLKSSKTAFQPLLSASLSEKRFRDTILDVPDPSSILNIIIHTFYALPCDKHSPTLDDLETAIDRFKAYGLDPRKVLVPDEPLYRLLLFHAPVSPLRVYTLAAQHDIQPLAMSTSTYLLSTPFSSITDDMAIRMGPSYLNRLAKLQWGRIDKLKATILQPPVTHPSTDTCDFTDQKIISRAWALAASYLAWDADPGISISKIQSTFMALGDHVTCASCKEALSARVKEVVVRWANVQRTISCL